MVTIELGFVGDLTAGFMWLTLCMKGALFSFNVTEEWLGFTLSPHMTVPVSLM